MPDEWIFQLFKAQAYLELQLNEEALNIYMQLSDAGLSQSSYIKAQTALALHNLRRKSTLVFRTRQNVIHDHTYIS